MDLDVSTQLDRILDEYGDKVEKVASQAIEEVAKQTANKLKGSSPNRSGKYARGWKVKKEGGVGIANSIVYNATAPQLTHLLENGHVIRNKKGTYGRVGGIKHIKPAEEEAKQEIIDRIERSL